MRMCFRGYRKLEALGTFTMGPKKPQKVTKAQRAKQQQEEEERRAREEEQARLQMEREEQERMERERKEEELQRLELKDRERRSIELDELGHVLEENHAAVARWKSESAEKHKWERYMRCDELPNPAERKDVNTFISLWVDDPEVNFAPVMKQCHLALQLVEDLESLLREVPDPREGLKYQECLTDMIHLIYNKHSLAALEILKGASSNIDTETGNMQMLEKDGDVTLCLWANLRRDLRFYNLKFEGVGLQFELPKPLATRPVAVRILHTCYDHLTLLATLSQLRIHNPSHRSLSTMEQGYVEESEQDEPEDETMKDDDVTQQPPEEQQPVEAGDDSRSKSVTSVLSRHSDLPAEGRVSQIQTQMEALEAAGEFTSPDLVPVAGNAGRQVVDLKKYSPLGGVFYFDVFNLPPQAHQVNGWEMRQILNSGLERFHYPSDLEELESLTCSPVGVSVTLPDSVLFWKTPQVARWDAAEGQWRTDGITDLSQEEKAAKISFKMDSFYTFALIQETYCNFPLQRWTLQPLDQDSAVLTVQGTQVELRITIQGSRCMLQLHGRTGPSHLVGKWMSRDDLQRAMVQAGINIFVNEYSENYVSVCAKDPLTEHAVYEQMALYSSSCAFSWSKWNSVCGAEHLVVQACEHLDPYPVQETSWGMYLIGAQRIQKLAMTETSQTFSPEHQPGTDFHSTFIHMLQDHMSATGMARTGTADFLFVDTVQSLLCSIRPLVFS
ncbi:dynein axonemal intermediate chain 7 isoform 2-T2 [Synchiropus picturatus]